MLSVFFQFQNLSVFLPVCLKSQIFYQCQFFSDARTFSKSYQFNFISVSHFQKKCKFMIHCLKFNRWLLSSGSPNVELTLRSLNSLLVPTLTLTSSLDLATLPTFFETLVNLFAASLKCIRKNFKTSFFSTKKT